MPIPTPSETNESPAKEALTIIASNDLEVGSTIKMDILLPEEGTVNMMSEAIDLQPSDSEMTTYE